ncbi:MAG: hypothetical protein WBE45_04670 [Terriglobales bacterium]|jgi:hypothetical protein
MTVFGQAQVDPWLILASGEKGTINSHTTRKDLVRTYGAANVVDQDVDIGEGEMQSGTFLFPEDPQRQIEILWKDPDHKTAPESAQILGKKSLWHGVHGITLGTSVRELERLNGRPFRFALTNDGTDMAEETIAWQGGRLEKEFQGNGRIILQIESSPTKGAKPRSPADFEVDSDNPVWRAQTPHISEVTWFFASNAQR